MSQPKRRPNLIRSFRLRHIGQYFLRGILLLAPVLITFSLVLWLFRTLDGAFAPVVTTPGAGLVVLLLSIVLIGWVSSFFFIQRSFGIVGKGLEHMPGVSFIYTSLRDFFEAFVGNKRRFTQAVLVNVGADEVWLVGFLTDEDAGNFELGKDFVSVYVPQAYNVAGQLYLVKRERIRLLENHSPADVMKYAVSGGAVEITDKDA